MKFIKEIKTVGLWNWLWFVFYLRRNEFSPKLERAGVVNLDTLYKRRRAHNIDLQLSHLKKD